MSRRSVALIALSSLVVAACAHKARVQEVPAVAAEPAVAASPADSYYSPADLDRGAAIWLQETRENYAKIEKNGLRRVADQPVSTFSIDVDSGSYSNVRRMLNAGHLPPADAVRSEEFINYFDYAYAPPTRREDAFSVQVDLAPSPWAPQRHLLLVGLKGYEVPTEALPPANLVFLIDTSGSMMPADKLDLLKDAFKQLIPKLRRQDRVSIVVYAGSAGVVLPPTPGDRERVILGALNRLDAGGSTNGGAGIELAYRLAREARIEHGINRVILATDGDFNVGISDLKTLKSYIAGQRKDGIGLTTLGFGTDNYNDELSEQLADIGNGNHAYIDSLNEANKVLGEEMSSTLFTIAHDVKVQVEFNPAQVAEYRLIGYENRMLAREDFNDDRVDAGEIGAGHDVTALYEIALVGSGGERVDPLRYGDAAPAADRASDELAFVKLRYKPAQGEASRLLSVPVMRAQIATAPSSRLLQAAAVTAFAERLRNDAEGVLDYPAIAAMARAVDLPDRYGHRAELIELIERAGRISNNGSAAAR